MAKQSKKTERQTAFIAGDVVDALDSTQGLTSGRRYHVEQVDDLSVAWGRLVAYHLTPVGQPLTRLTVYNGHLLLRLIEEG